MPLPPGTAIRRRDFADFGFPLNQACGSAMAVSGLAGALAAAPAHQIKHQNEGSGDPQNCGYSILTHIQYAP
jgi:hypothetical protein